METNIKMSCAKIAVIGDLMIDIQTGPLDKMPDWNTALTVENVKVLLGGCAGNTARYLGSLGNETRLFSVVGEDNLSKMAVNQIRDEGKVDINESLVTIPKSSAPTVVILYGIKKRSFIPNLGALYNFTANVINKKLLFQYDHLHFGGYFGCLGLQSDDFLATVEEAKKNGMTISMDPQIDAKREWAGVNRNLAKLLPLVDVFILSTYEAFGIAKEDTIKESMKALRKMMPHGLIVIKNGEYGVDFSTGDDVGGASTNVPAFKVEKVVDTIGSGCCFSAGFLHKWAQAKNGDRSKVGQKEYIANAVSYGCAAAKFCVEKVGAYVDDFGKEEVDELVFRNGV